MSKRSKKKPSPRRNERCGTAINGQFLAVFGEPFRDQPAEVADRQPGVEQRVDLQGKVPYFRADISRNV